MSSLSTPGPRPVTACSSGGTSVSEKIWSRRTSTLSSRSISSACCALRCTSVMGTAMDGLDHVV
eukprot:3236376-Prymnesium_polylepis.1